MQLAAATPAIARIARRAACALVAWKADRARRADERIILDAAARLNQLAPHFLDDAGLGHLAPRLPGPSSRDILHLQSSVLPLMPRA